MSILAFTLSTLTVGCRCGCRCYAKVLLFVIAFSDWFCGKNCTPYKEKRAQNRAVLEDIPLETIIVGIYKMAAEENNERRAFRLVIFELKLDLVSK